MVIRVPKLIAAMILTIGAVADLSAFDGLNDVEIIEPGNYPVQPCQLPHPLSISPCLAARLKLPGEQRVYPLAALNTSSLAAPQCPTHVHNFYYSGKSDFQCPIIQGGRTRIVTVHPATGEPLEFFAMLSAGAPKVQYRKNHFAYVYPDHRTVIKFPSIASESRVVVSQQQGQGLAQRTAGGMEQLQDWRGQLGQTNTAQSLKSAAASSQAEFSGLGVLLDRGISGTIDTTKAITDMLPGKAYLQSLSEQRVLDQRDNQIRDVQREASGLRRFIRWPE